MCGFIATGKLQLNNLPHPSFQHIQPLLSALLQHFYTSNDLLTPDGADTNKVGGCCAVFTLSESGSEVHKLLSLQLQGVVEWLSVMIDCFSCRLKSVTELAGLWTVLCSQCITPLSIPTERLTLLTRITYICTRETVCHHVLHICM